VAAQETGNATVNKQTEVIVQPSCEDEYDSALLPVDIALARIAEAIKPIGDIEWVPVRGALSRILAEDVISPVDVPNHTNSAMDGYALAASDLLAADLKVIGTAWAGSAYAGPVGSGECVRIMTGAVIPDRCDTVVMQEQAERIDDRIRLAAGQKPGQHVRRAGEDLAAGEVALVRGRCLLPSDLGMVASLGIGELAVLRKPRIAFFSNGDELRSIGETLALGDVYDSNRYTLHGMLTRLGVEFIDLGVIPDDRDRIRETFLRAAAIADVVITSAGASVGDADYVKEVLDEIGEVNFWKLAMKPGRPLSFGKIDHAHFFGLPGNPVSAMVTFYQFVLPAIRKICGETPREPLLIQVRCAEELKKAPGRMEFQRGILHTNSEGEMVVSTTGLQGSHVMHSMSRANCFIHLPAECAGVAAGKRVDVQPFQDLG